MDPLPQPATATASPRRPIWQSIKAFVAEWIRCYWVDVLWVALVGGVSLGMHMLPVPTTRTFPITLDKDGNIANLDLSYPARGWIIPTWTSGFITFAVPFAVYLLAQIRIKSAWDANSAIVGTIWAVLLATLFQLLTKALIGGFRPNFLDVCMPDIELAKDPLHNKTGLNGVGFHQVMYTIEICTQPDKGKLRTAITSFPSGHSAAGFAAFGFLFFWLNSKLKVWADYRPKFWKLTATMLPLLFAFVNSCLLTVDAAHHWYDILAGSIIGFAMAVAAYRTTYAALWDWRYNHLHLRGKEAFVYSSEDAVDYSAQTITREVGWGGKRDWLRLDPNTTGRRVTFADQTSSALPGGVTTRARPGTPAADAGHG